MKYEFCKDCPKHKEELEIEYDDGWFEIDPSMYCTLVLVDEKPKYIGDARGFPKPPDWCPLRIV